MAKSVVIVESEAKAKTLQEQMGGEVEVVVVRAAPVTASYVSPPDSARREKPHFDFIPEPREKVFLDRLLACKGREIYLGLDGDWRGEFWSWLISGWWGTVSPVGVQPQRLGLTGIAGEMLRESFLRVEPVSGEKGPAIYMRMLFEASLGRHLERLLGSRLGPKGLPLNYLSLTTLFLLAEREMEIRMYTPVAKWKVKVKVGSEAGEDILTLVAAAGLTADGFLRNEKEVRAVVALFSPESFLVREVTKSPLVVAPPEPYRLMELLQDAVAQGGLSPLAAMTAIRSLYYGVEMDGRRLGLITAFLPPLMAPQASVSLFAGIREEVGRRLGESFLGAETDREIPGGLILPTEPLLGPEELAGKLAPAEEAIYRLVWSRALASQMKEAQGELFAVTVAAGKSCLFQGKAKVLREKGFLAVCPGGQGQEFSADSSLLAAAQPGQTLRSLQIIPEKNSGLPPEYYGLVELAADLGDFSLEIDGMTVAMLQQMLDHDYLRMMPDGCFRCGESTATLVRVTSCAFPTMKGIQLSAYLAQTIEEAVSGRKPLAFALQQFEQTMMMRGEVLVKMAVPVAGKRRSITSRSVIRLPEEGKSAKLQVSGGEVAPCRVVKEARPAAAETTLSADVERQPLAEEGSEAGVAPTPANEAASEEALLTLSAEEDEPAEGVGGTVEAPKAGSVPGLEEQAVAALAEPAPDPALVAEGIIVGAAAPATSLAEPSSLSAESGIPAMLEPDLAGVESARVCPDCGRVLLLKEDRFGRYWHCSGHPQCRHAESCEKGPGPGLLCPVCRVGTVVTKQTPTGKIFYLCPEQGCAFMAWSTPHAIACPVCASPFLVEKKDPAGGVFLHCPRAGCTHTQALSATGEAGSAPVGAPLKKKVLVRRVAPGSGGGATKKVRIVRRKK